MRACRPLRFEIPNHVSARFFHGWSTTDRLGRADEPKTLQGKTRGANHTPCARICRNRQLFIWVCSLDNFTERQRLVPTAEREEITSGS
jgi:hypothetical protein